MRLPTHLSLILVPLAVVYVVSGCANESRSTLDISGTLVDGGSIANDGIRFDHGPEVGGLVLGIKVTQDIVEAEQPVILTLMIENVSDKTIKFGYSRSGRDF